MFCVQSKSMPGSYFVDKETFAQITANADKHVIENINNPIDVAMVNAAIKRRENEHKQQTPEIEPLESPNMDEIDDSKGITAAASDLHPAESGVMVHNRPETEPLISPALEFEN